MYSYEANGRGNTSATDAKLLERKSQFINLPAVTPEDNGTVLGVAGGKWQPVPGGGGGMMVVHLLGVEEENYSIDKTFAEIEAALPNVVMYDDYNGYIYHCEGFTGEGIAFSSLFAQYGDDSVEFIHCETFDVLRDDSVVRYFGSK